MCKLFLTSFSNVYCSESATAVAEVKAPGRFQTKLCRGIIDGEALTLIKLNKAKIFYVESSRVL